MLLVLLGVLLFVIALPVKKEDSGKGQEKENAAAMLEELTASTQTVTAGSTEEYAAGTTERNWVTLFKQYENVEELNRRVLMSLVDRILIHENHAIEIVFKYRDEYQQTLEYVLGYADELDIAV